VLVEAILYAVLICGGSGLLETCRSAAAGMGLGTLERSLRAEQAQQSQEGQIHCCGGATLPRTDDHRNLAPVIQRGTDQVAS
jgi:hypothetical protein